MKIKIYRDQDTLYQDVLNHLIANIRNFPSCNLGLATGSSPERLYQKMIKAYQHNLVDFSQVATFNLDEYVGLETTHDASYNFYM